MHVPGGESWEMEQRVGDGARVLGARDKATGVHANTAYAVSGDLMPVKEGGEGNTLDHGRGVEAAADRTQVGLRGGEH